jgi:RHH-type proline utilization regulon transcriptional repressor/proline dehydrogenase/delta 1-pyrroline-5-carboxylate dehydrogenase
MPASTLRNEASALINSACGKTLTIEERCELSIKLAGLMLLDAQEIQTTKEKQIQNELSRMMNDQNGKAFTTSMTDQCFRSNRSERVADQLVFLLNKFGVPHFLSQSKKIALNTFKHIGNYIPKLLVPLVKSLIRKETSTVILPGEPKELSRHMAQRRQDHVRINLNHLGEAILGEEEAAKRLQIYLDDLAKLDIEYISVKISTISSQLNLLSWQETIDRLSVPLKQLYRSARDHLYTRSDGQKVPKFVNLDMEEFRDLHLTVELFKQVLDDPEFVNHSAGIVLQSYEPDSYGIQQDLTAWAKKRVLKGGAPIKIRIVKGANLAMEQVEASLKGWPQAPYTKKIDVDANFKRMVIFGCKPENAVVATLGIGSHNLFDIAFTMLLRVENNVEKDVCFEMLEGMADHMRRVVQGLSGDMLLYCPAATKEEFQNAVAYLIRRLDENTAPNNFLRHSFGLKPETESWNSQAQLFQKACQRIENVGSKSRRFQNRLEEPTEPPFESCFVNEPDTDWSLPPNRKWAEIILTDWKSKKFVPIPIVIAGESIVNDHVGMGEDPSEPGKQVYKYSLASLSDVEKALKTATITKELWGQSTIEERSRLLAKVAQEMRIHRADLIGAMVIDTGKTIPEGDVEVSEAIDFAEYYRRNIEDVNTLEDIQWTSKGTIFVAPPWNFPCSIPAGGILAALATGNCVIFKPAPEAVLVGWELVQLFWKAGFSKEVLQFICCEDDTVGSQLIKDPRINTIILTGGTATAKLFMKMRPGVDLMAETGGKNALIISGLSDRDLAIKDLIQSAFGHAGQKCSACSLAVCVGEVYDDPNFLEHLRDAAASWKVGSPWDLATRLNPLIHTPNETLLRGLTNLDTGEEWLLKPVQNEKNPNLWSPGIKLGVKPSSFSYRHELFGPVLSIMRAENLEHAIQLANGTPYGLTSGLHSLDEREQQLWLKKIEAGNCYINRGITGAIVQRQPFGGCKESSFGPGAKAGGPNYLMQFMHPEQKDLPRLMLQNEEYPKAIQAIQKFFELGATQEQLKIWQASIGSYLFFWKHYFSKDHDPSMILGQDNLLRYVPQNTIVLRVQPADSLLDVLRVIAAAVICGTSLEVTAERPLLKDISTASWLESTPNIKIVKETEGRFIKRIERMSIKRVRFLSQPSVGLMNVLANAGSNILLEPVLANARIELLRYLREVSISIDYHRYGNLGIRENEPRGSQMKQSCSNCKCKNG